jgi:hypothetical protein
MGLFLVRFIEKWIEEGRFPREELRAKWWIVSLGALTIATLVAAILLR